MARGSRVTGAHSAAAPGAVSAALVVAANDSRSRVVITNNGAQVVYIGKTSGVTSATGTPIASGASWEDPDSVDAWYAVAASGTGDLRIIETSYVS